MLNMPLRLFLVRHGQTDHNVQGIMQGHLDTPLNDTGRHQAQLLAKALSHISFQAAFSSDSSRAQNTANAVLHGCPGIELQTTPLLRERDMGDYSGLKWPVTGSEKERIRPETVETSASMRQRIIDFMSTCVIPLIPLQGDCNVLVTSHGAMISQFVHLLLSSRGPFGFMAGSMIPDRLGSCWNTSISEVLIWLEEEKNSDGAILQTVQGEVVTWADVRHLTAQGEDDKIRSADAVAV